MYYPLLKIHRKSLKIDNKFTQNQWKLNEIIAQNDPFLNEILTKFKPNLAQFYGQILRKWPNFDQVGQQNE